MNLVQAIMAAAPDAWRRRRLLRKYWARQIGAKKNHPNRPPEWAPKKELWPGAWWWYWSFPNRRYHLEHAVEQSVTFHLHDHTRQRKPDTRWIQHYFMSDFGYWSQANRDGRDAFLVPQEKCPSGVLACGGVLSAYFQDPKQARSDIPTEYYGLPVVIKKSS